MVSLRQHTTKVPFIEIELRPHVEGSKEGSILKKALADVASTLWPSIKWQPWPTVAVSATITAEWISFELIGCK